MGEGRGEVCWSVGGKEGNVPWTISPELHLSSITFLSCRKILHSIFINL